MKKIIMSTFIFLMLFNILNLNVYANETETSAPYTYSYAAVSMDADSSCILYAKNGDKKIYPASTTKILTAILAIENLDLNKIVTVSKTAIQIPWDSSSVYLKEGEVISINDLLYCLLLYSGNDAANVLAEAVSGNIPDFVKLMNEKATALGCTNTNFVNAHGYSDNNHYTTALDMAKIFRYCIQNEKFAEIVSTKLYIVPATNKTKSKRHLYNTNRLILTKDESVHSRYYEYAIGGKTGYTDEAGKTLVTFGKKDGKTVILTLFKAGMENGRDARYTDAINLFNYSFNNFSKLNFAKTEDYTFEYINYTNKLKYTVELEKAADILVRNGDTVQDLSYTIQIDDSKLTNIDKENIPQNTIVGTITYNITTTSNNYTSTNNLILKQVDDFIVISSNNIFVYIIIAIIIIFILKISIRIIKATHKTKRIKEKNTIKKTKSTKHYDTNSNISRKKRRI